MRTEPELSYHGPVVVFDLDDTLYTERYYAIGAYHKVAAQPQFAIDGLPGRIVDTMTSALTRHSNPFDELEAMLAKEYPDIKIDIPELVAVYRSHKPTFLPLRDGSYQCLDELNRRGIRMGIITDGRSLSQRAKISALDIERFFHPADIIISEESGADKRVPDNFVAIVHHYPEAKEFYYIGDNPCKDFDIPSQLGWKILCVRDEGFNIHNQGAGFIKDYMIDSLAQVPEIVLG